MRQVYSPLNQLEAHMLAHLLEQSGIKAHIHGEALKAAEGGLPVGNLLQLLVAEEDFDEARRIVLEWEAGNRETIAARPKRKLPVATALLCLAIGGAIGWGFHFYARSHVVVIPGTQVSYDDNNDGAPDRVSFYRAGFDTPYRTQIDSDFDGKWNDVVFYDEAGRISESDMDQGFDGYFELKEYYAGNFMDHTELTEPSGAMIEESTYDRGVLKAVSRYDLGRVARIDHFENFRIHDSELDRDRDGFLETLLAFDRVGDVTSTTTRPKP